MSYQCLIHYWVKNMELQISFEVDSSVIRGMLHMPDGITPFPAIAFCHGYFQSNRIGPSRLYVMIARRLSSDGIACLRFDCRGMGESDKEFGEATYESFATDLYSALDYLRRLKGIDKERLGLIGHSMGANIALDVASRVPKLRGLCLLSPDSVRSPAKKRILTKEQILDLRKKGYTERRGILLRREFLSKILEGISFQRAEYVASDTLIMQGSADQYYSKNDLLCLAKNFTSKTTIIEIQDADHNFYPTSCREQLMKIISTWFIKTFKLHDTSAT